MAKKIIPNKVYVCLEFFSGKPTLTVYESLDEGLPEGKVAVFEKIEEVDLRIISQVKRPGDKEWTDSLK